MQGATLDHPAGRARPERRPLSKKTNPSATTAADLALAGHTPMMAHH
jgi:hypothetical protein